MWNIVILTVMVSLTGYYMTANKNAPTVAIMPMAEPYAENMAMYREAVIAWFAANPGVTGTGPSLNQLKAVLPAGSTLADSPMAALWSSYRVGNLIYVFDDAKNPPPVNIGAALLDISHQSALVGIYQSASGGHLLSLSRQDSAAANAELKAPPAAANVSDGSLVWVAGVRS